VNVHWENVLELLIVCGLVAFCVWRCSL